MSKALGTNGAISERIWEEVGRASSNNLEDSLKLT